MQNLGYNEFIRILKVDPVLAGSSNVVIQWWDPEEPPLIQDNFAADDWTKIDISQSTPFTADGIFLTVIPLVEKLPPVQFAVRSSKDEVIIESFMSQISPYFLHLGDGDTEIEARIVGNKRAVKILSRGFRFLR